jgi:hypothetical protein
MNEPLSEQARINAALDEIKEWTEAEVLRGQWTMTQMIIRKFKLGQVNCTVTVMDNPVG